MNLSLRIRLVIASFVMVILLVGGLSIHYLNLINRNTESVFAGNYEILLHSREIDDNLDKIQLHLARFDSLGNKEAVYDVLDGAINSIERHLQRQEMLMADKVVEISMHTAIVLKLDSLKIVLNKMKVSADGIRLSEEINNLIVDLNQANTRLLEYEAGDIMQRFDRTRKTTGRLVFYMAIITTNFVVIAIILYILFPGYIIEPVKEMTNRIKAISEKDFSQRIETKKRDEFGVLAHAFNEMAQRLDHYENLNLNEMLREKQRTEAIINNLNEAILVTDESDRVVWVNHIAEQLMGVSREYMMERKLSEIQAGNPSIDSQYKDRSGHSAIQQLFNTTAIVDGRKKYYHKELIAVGPNGSGKVIIYYDITPFKELDQAKTNFMGTLSHQFKTPISAASISINLLFDDRIGQMNPEQKKLLETIRLHNKRLLNMVNELLDVSQIESGKISLKEETILPSDLAEYALFSVKNVLDERNILIEKNFEELNANILGDRDKLTWVLNNILMNAIRFSPEMGKIIIEIKKKAQKGKNQVLYTVSDEGPGISKANQARIFNRYESEDGDERSGSGIGLSIARDIIEAHHGRIGVKSDEKKGSTFYFCLPLSNGRVLG